MVARKLRTAAICKAPSSGLWENCHGNVFHSSKIPKKNWPWFLAPLLIFVGVMGHRWYLCGSGWCISPGVNIKKYLQPPSNKTVPLFSKETTQRFWMFLLVGRKKSWPQEKRGNFANMFHRCWGKRMAGKKWNNHDSIRNSSSVAIISTFQKAIWKRSHRDFGSSKKVSKKNNNQKIPHPSSFFSSAISKVFPFCKDLGTSPGWEANMAKPSGSTGPTRPGKLDSKIGGKLDLMSFGCTKGS